MNFKTLMKQTIEEEIAKIESSGEKVRLKTLASKRILYTMISAVVFSIGLAAEMISISFCTLIVYFILLYNTNNVSVLTKMAEKSPDTPIENIIRSDMK